MEKWRTSFYISKFKCYCWNYNRLGYSGRKMFLPIMAKDFSKFGNEDILKLSIRNQRKIFRIIRHKGIFLIKTELRDVIQISRRSAI
jgi:hypothetical protein